MGRPGAGLAGHGAATGDSRIPPSSQGICHRNSPARNRPDPTSEREKQQRIGEREHPLTDGLLGQHMLDEVGGGIGHASRATARANAPALATERHELLMPAGIALDAQESVIEAPALQVRLRLFDDEMGERDAFGIEALEKPREVLFDEGVEGGLLRAVTFVRECVTGQSQSGAGAIDCPRSWGGAQDADWLRSGHGELRAKWCRPSPRGDLSSERARGRRWRSRRLGIAFRLPQRARVVSNADSATWTPPS